MPRDRPLVLDVVVGQVGACVPVQQADGRITCPGRCAAVPLHFPHIAAVTGAVVAEAADLLVLGGSGRRSEGVQGDVQVLPERRGAEESQSASDLTN